MRHCLKLMTASTKRKVYDGYGGAGCERVTPLTGRSTKKWLQSGLFLTCQGFAVFLGLVLLNGREK